MTCVIRFSTSLGAHAELLNMSPRLPELKNGMCVCFIGIDGSGKTSQAISLSKNLSKIGIESLYVRPEYLLVKCLPQALIRWVSRHVFGISKKIIRKPERPVERQADDVGLNIIKFTLTLAFLIYVWLAYILMVRSQLSKRVLICDRYFYDWIYYLDKNRSTFLMQLVPKPDLIFLLDVEIPVAFSRMHSMEDKGFSADYYSSLREWYLTLAKEYGFMVINSIHDFGKTKQAILEHTMSSLRMRGLFVS